MESKAAEIADWMLAEVKERGILRQEDVVQHIADNYGEQYLYTNENGNQSIDKEVKKLFKKLHRGKAAWDRDGFFWGWT
ncbi:DUF6953 family protein [Paenibacillus daejeonensis]|uniref:DUF6953 family protein n=1 Tax=Paenibacillus daejeonensis TaxID=135193 RepID=UPI0003721290|nr:hypothetical protein [Paenibacillus daejeonensis]